VKAKVRATNWRTGKPSDNPSHNIDHIWELNLMKLFFESVLPTQKKPSGTLTCADFDAAFIVPGSKPADKPIQQLYARMPQALLGKTATMDTLEFSGTSVELNSKKGRILVPKEPDGSGTSLSSAAQGYTLRNTKDKVHALRTVGTAFDFMNDAAITALFNRAQTRLKDYLKEVDAQLATSKVNLSRPDFKWATEFQTWMGKHLNASCDDSNDWVQSVLREVKKEISKMPQQTAARKTDRQMHETYLITFMNSKYSKKEHYKLNWKA
jgi:hypothetical protein